MNKILGTLFLGLLFCNIAQAESSLPGCQGSKFPTWTNCYGKVGPLPISGDIYTGEWQEVNITDKELSNIQMEQNMLDNGKVGLPNGQGTLTDSSGNKYVGEFEDGKRHGIGNHTSS